MNSLQKKYTKPILWAAAGAGALSATYTMLRRRRRYQFQNQVVLLTGGSRGLGLVLARQLARVGARLALCARDGAELARAAAELRGLGAEVFTCVCDVTQRDQVENMVRAVHAQYGRIDTLINNAGVIQVGPLAVQTLQDFQDAMATHFWGPLYTTWAVLPEMRARRAGRIVNIASIGGKVAVPHLAPYCASKFALAGLSAALRAELASDGIVVTTVCPGLMRTGSHLNAIFKGRNKAEFAWFSIGNNSRLSSVSAERAAREILRACQRGDAQLVISLPAEIAVWLQTAFPELTAEIFALVNRLLPGPGGIGEGHAFGHESVSALTPAILTNLIDEAALLNNEAPAR